METKELKTTTLTAKIQGNGTVRDAGGYAEVSSYTNEREEYDILRGGIGVMDLSASGKIRISGDEHVEFVNQLVTKDIEFFDVEKTMYTLLLNEEGHPLGLINLFKQDESILLVTTPDTRDAISAWLLERKTDEVEIEDVSDELSIIAFEGPYSWKLAQTIIDFEISSLPFQAFVETEWQGHNMLFSRTGVTGEYGYQVVLPTEAADELWDTLLNFSEDDIKVQAIGMDALETTMLEVRHPQTEVAAAHNLSLFEACLEWFVSFHKDSFVGSDALQELKDAGVAKRIIGFAADPEQAVSANSPVLVENVEVGHVLQVKFSPLLGKNLGLALVEDTYAVSGIELGAQNEAGERIDIQTQSSPYVFPKSWSIKIV